MNTSKGFNSVRSSLSARGVSLIEALLALVVMSLGMLAVIGVQATLRINGDLARQRAEAVRLAQVDIENIRAFTGVVAAGGRDFTDIISTGPNDVTPLGSNAVYTLTRTVPLDPPNGSPPFRTVGVSVQWADRSGGPAQEVVLFTGVARIAPALSASLSVPPNGGPALQPQGRHFSIPKSAVPISPGQSRLDLPATPGLTATSLIFNNISGQITCIQVSRTCSPNEVGQLLNGFIGVPNTNPSFEISIQYTTNGDLTPTNRSESCFIGPLENAQTLVREYFCVIHMPTTQLNNPTWTGIVVFGPPTVFYTGPFPAPNGTLGLRACRNLSVNATYANVGQPLSNQNFRLALPSDPCPPGTTAH